MRFPLNRESRHVASRRHTRGRRSPVTSSRKTCSSGPTREVPCVDTRLSRCIPVPKGCPGDVRVFGSVARGEETPESDVDFLVSLEAGRTLLDLAKLETQLEHLLRRPADVATPGSLRESIRATALREAVRV